MTRLIRLLPLAALVLTACTVTQPKGPGKSPDSPQWRQHQQDVRNLNQYQTRGAFAYLSDEQKGLCPLLLAADGAGQLPPAAAEPAGQHRAGAYRQAGRSADHR